MNSHLSEFVFAKVLTALAMVARFEKGHAALLYKQRPATLKIAHSHVSSISCMSSGCGLTHVSLVTFMSSNFLPRT